VRNNPHLSRVWVFEKHSLFSPRGLWAFFADLRRQKFDLAIPLFGNTPSFTSFALAHLSSAKMVWSHDTTSFYGGASWSRSLAVPEYQRFSHLVEKLAPVRTEHPELHTSAEDEAAINDIWPQFQGPAGKPIVCLFLGGNPSRLDRLWTPARWADLARFFLSAGMHVVAICRGGKPDTGFYALVRDHVGKDVPVFDLPGIGKAAAFMRRLDLFICPDGGLFHVSCAVGTPTLGLFFGTDPERWRPPVPHAFTIRCQGNDPMALSAERVFAAAVDALQPSSRIKQKDINSYL
jgi:ADP-heptose:LPS heptosyltransferase